MAGYGVIGAERGGRQGKKVITANLDDLYDRATQADEEFFLHIAVPQSPEAGLVDVIEWAQTKEVWYKLFQEKGFSDEMAIEGASEQTTHKTYEECVEAVIGQCSADELALLVLHDDNDEALGEVVERALGEGLEAFALNNASMEQYEYDDAAGEGEEEAADDEEAAGADDDDAAFDADAVIELGRLADEEGDEEAASALQEMAEGVIDKDEFDKLSWSEVAALVVTNAEGDEEPVAITDTISKTRQELANMHIRELRSLARAQGWDGSKVEAPEIIEILLGTKDVPGQEEAEEAPVPAKRTRRKAAAAPDLTNAGVRETLIAGLEAIVTELKALG